MRHALIEGGGRVSARRPRHLFFASPKKSAQKKGDPAARVPTRPVGEWGNLRCSVLGWCRRTHCVLPSGELRSNSCGKPDHEVRVSFGTRTHPRPCASRRSQQGWGAGTTRLLLAQLRLGSVRAVRCRRTAQPPWRAERSEGPQAERSNGPCGARSHPLLTVPRSAEAGVSACRRTRASSSGSPKLFDRSCLAEAAQGVLRRHPRPARDRAPS